MKNWILPGLLLGVCGFATAEEHKPAHREPGHPPHRAQEPPVPPQVMRHRETMQKELTHIDDLVRQQRERVQQEAKRPVISPRTIEAVGEALELEQQSLELDMVGLAARKKALEETVAELTHRTRKQLEDDAVSREIERVVKMREEALRRAREMAQTGRDAQPRDAEEALAEARMRLMERREQLHAAGGGELVQELNRQLLETAINLRETEARLDAVRQRLARMHAAMPSAHQLRELEEEREVLRHEMRRMSQEIDRRVEGQRERMERIRHEQAEQREQAKRRDLEPREQREHEEMRRREEAERRMIREKEEAERREIQHKEEQERREAEKKDQPTRDAEKRPTPPRRDRD